LFSAIIAAFIIEIYKTLLPSNGQNATGIPSNAVRINIVLFLSFFLSMMNAVGCALILQWCDEYEKFSDPQATLPTSGRVRTYLFQGLEYFQMRRFVYGIHVLLHISVFLFFWALSDFFHNVNPEFGTVTRYSLVGSIIIYVLLSISPLIFSNSPYNTPMTPPIRAAGIILRIVLRSPLLCSRWIRGQSFMLTGLPYYEGIHFDRARLNEIEARKRADNLEPYAMKWLFTNNDFSDSNVDKFLDGLPGYMSSGPTERGNLDEYLTDRHIESRIKEHLITCATSMELSDEATIARVSSSVKAIVLIFQYSRKRKGGPSKPRKLEGEMQQQEYIQGLMRNFQTLCDVPYTTALRVSCIRALAIQGFLSQPVAPYITRTPLPASLIPIYDYLFPNDNTVTEPKPGYLPIPSDRDEWIDLLKDGPLANLTRLAQAIRDKGPVPPSILSFCWKTLDILLTHLGTIYSANSKLTRAQSDFDNLHENTRTYVHGEEMGFHMRPLLEILDTVARGQRLLIAFSGDPFYYGKANIVFGKEYLRNRDLLEAFARYLPEFIAANSSDVCADFMEKVVNHDNLWASLQVNLPNIDNPIPDNHGIFEDCCTVLVSALSVLDDSQKVDWRAPEFVSLWHHFEPFITHGFQGEFMGRAACLLIGIIKAQFCKILLAQFWDDIIRRNVLSFRSQCDVASLLKLIDYLGLRDEDGPEFWNSHLNGGHHDIGSEFMTKALKMVNIISRDGTLLIFCQLGHLAISTMRSHRFGQTDLTRYIWTISNLQDKLMLDRRPPFYGASDTVWEDLDRLREQVEDCRGAASRGAGDTGIVDQEGTLLQFLLRRIDAVRDCRVTPVKGPSHKGHAEGRCSDLSRQIEIFGGSFSNLVHRTTKTRRRGRV
jgi:hypothetical protein